MSRNASWRWLPSTGDVGNADDLHPERRKRQMLRHVRFITVFKMWGKKWPEAMIILKVMSFPTDPPAKE